METKCRICNTIIPPHHARVSNQDFSVCLQCENHETLVYVVELDGSFLFEKELSNIIPLLEEMEDDSSYHISRKIMKTIKYLALPEFIGF